MGIMVHFLLGAIQDLYHQPEALHRTFRALRGVNRNLAGAFALGTAGFSPRNTRLVFRV